jgi:hypothetical protein
LGGRSSRVTLVVGRTSCSDSEGDCAEEREALGGKNQGIEVEETGVSTGGSDVLAPHAIDLNQVAVIKGSQASGRICVEKIPALERPGNRGGKRQEKATCPNLKHAVHLVLDRQLGRLWKLDKQREQLGRELKFRRLGFEGLFPKGTALAPERRVGPTDPAEFKFEMKARSELRGRKLPP